ncbi:PIG-L family deacetylase [Telmatobacter bradus]|uniref:PIG-L family deacetylase n=1 Tax=Telmatobacter bradus TaxID=474953 RepID=UPI003B42DB64
MKHPRQLAALSLAVSLTVASSLAQSPVALDRPLPSAYSLTIDRGAAGLWQSLQKLKTRSSLIMVVAHPDDEDGGMLAYESRGAGVDTTLLTLNRGEGGQNLMTSDYWDELGLIRTQELLAAGDFYGVRQRFTSMADFGFSKSLDEALKKWGHDHVLYDVVRQVRISRPLVVTSVFAGSVSDGHGHHQTAGLMAQEAYKLAGDPQVFPDQIAAGLRPWSPLKVYAHVPVAHISEKGIFDYATGHYAPLRFKNYVTGEWIEGVPSATVTVPEGTYNPLFGRSYLDLGQEGLAQQKSQDEGIGAGIQPAGPYSSAYHLYASRLVTPTPATGTSLQETSFFDGIDTTLAAIADYAPAEDRAPWRNRLEKLDQIVQSATVQFDASVPEKCADTLAEGLTTTRLLRRDLQASTLPADARFDMDHELGIKEEQFNLALLQSLGISLVATLDSDAPRPAAFPGGPMLSILPTAPSVVPGQNLRVNLHIANQGSREVKLVVAQLQPAEGKWDLKAQSALPAQLAAGEGINSVFSGTVPVDAEPTRPYFTRPSLEQSYYDLSHPQDLGLPTAPYPLSAHLSIAFEGVEASIDSVVQSVQRINALGTELEPLVVAPAISVTLAPRHGLIPLGSRNLDLEAAVHSNMPNAVDGVLQLQLPEGWSSEPASATFHLAHAGEEKPIRFHLFLHNLTARKFTVTAIATASGKQYSEGFTTLGYPGLRHSPEARPASYTATAVDLKTTSQLRVGYVMGPGDSVADALKQIGIPVTQLSAQDLTAGDITAYDAILIGIRAYTTRTDLRASNSRLLDYVKAGGVLVVQYQAAEFNHNYGPYALAVPGNAETVVEEDSAVQLDSSDPLLSWPNRITPADFQDWVEERGHGFAAEWASEFAAPTAVHDTDQAPQRGGLLWSHYGKGVYIYTSYAFFRQMPEGVPGAFRIIANLISASRNPAFQSKTPQRSKPKSLCEKAERPIR